MAKKRQGLSTEFLHKLLQKKKKSFVRVDDPGFETRQGKKTFCYLKRPEWVWVPSSLLFPGFLPEVKAAGK
jgi:hypothetical protein